MQLLAFSHFCFHAQIWQFYKSACISENPAHSPTQWKQAQFQPLRCRKRVHMQLLACFSNSCFHAQIRQCYKLADISISETAACTVKIISILTTWSKKRVYMYTSMQILALFSNSSFYTQIWQFGKAACTLETTTCRVKISSISTPGILNWRANSVF